MYRNVHQLKFTKTMTRKGFKYLEIKYKMNLGEELKIIWKHPLHALKAHVKAQTPFTCALRACKGTTELQNMDSCIRGPPQTS